MERIRSFFILSNATCTPCSISESGSISFNATNSWSNIGPTFCIGHTENDKVSATFYISLQINTSYSNPNYINSLEYQIAIYNDDSKSYPSINSSMSCSQKLDPLKFKKKNKVRFDESNTYFAEIPIVELITREWWVFITHCDETESSDIIYPIIDYQINVTQSSFVMKREKTCEGKTNEVPISLVLGIIGIVVAVLIIGGLSIWGCDVYKRKQIRNKAINQELIMEEDSNDDDNDSMDDNTMEKDDIQLQTA